VGTTDDRTTTAIILSAAKDSPLPFCLSFPAGNLPQQASNPLKEKESGVEGRGKRGGARVIYFFHNAAMPVFLLTAYAKNAKENLSPSEYTAFRQLTKLIVESHAGRRR
jgi:hypothetical protein